MEMHVTSVSFFFFTSEFRRSPIFRVRLHSSDFCPVTIDNFLLCRSCLIQGESKTQKQEQNQKQKQKQKQKNKTKTKTKKNCNNEGENNR